MFQIFFIIWNISIFKYIYGFQISSAAEVGLGAAGPHQAQWWHISVQDSELQTFPLQIPTWSII